MPQRWYAGSSVSTACGCRGARRAAASGDQQPRSVPLPGPDTGRLRVVGVGARTAGAPGLGSGSPPCLATRPKHPGRTWSSCPPGSGTSRPSPSCPDPSRRGDVAAVLLEADEAVLVANRLPDGPSGAVPVLDEVPVDDVLAADCAAVEVTPHGHPLRIADRPAPAVGRASTSTRCTPRRRRSSPPSSTTPPTRSSCTATTRTPAARPVGWASFAGRRAGPPRRGARHDPARGGRPVDGYALPPGEVPVDVDDLWTVDLSEIGGRVRTRIGSAGTKSLGVAGLTAAGSVVDPADALSAALEVPVRVAGTESEAARLGALSTPRAPGNAVVVDLGGGTIDVVTHERAVVAAGAGDLLTLCVAELTGTTAAAAEWVKRGPSRRAEAPQVVLGEDGRRTFLDAPLPSDALGSLVVGGPAGLARVRRRPRPLGVARAAPDLKTDLVGRQHHPRPAHPRPGPQPARSSWSAGLRPTRRSSPLSPVRCPRVSWSPAATWGVRSATATPWRTGC